MSLVDVLFVFPSFFSRLNCFTFVISGPLIGDLVVWALLIVEGRTMTYSWKFLCSFVSCGELSDRQSYHILFYYICKVHCITIIKMILRMEKMNVTTRQQPIQSAENSWRLQVGLQLRKIIPQLGRDSAGPYTTLCIRSVKMDVV